MTQNVNISDIFAAVTVSKGRSSNAKYALTGNIVQAALPAQAVEVLRAMTLEGQSAEQIAASASIKTKQSVERIVRYYMPTLMKLDLAKRV